jgi:predicted O-methyltransferase YrrM
VVTAIHPFAVEAHRTGTAELPDGSRIPATSFIPADVCSLLYDCIEVTKARRAIETGMAFGISSLCIADALSKNGSSYELVSIDPCQTTDWKSAGLHLIHRAGLSVTLLEETSQLALPRLVAAGRRFDFGFIDGWHTFDHTLIDFFYMDMMLEAGGFIVFDDVGYPAINAVTRFVLANRDYELVKALGYEVPASIRLRRAIKRQLRPLARTDHDPSAVHALLFRQTEQAHSIAVRKRGEDRRRFDHFESF